MTRVAETSNQCELSDSASHLVISAQVIDRSCVSELADTMVLDPIRVDSIQMMSQLTNADLPMPRPDDTAMRNTPKSILPPFCLMCSARSRSTSRCHLRGPEKFSNGVPGCPHGNRYRTNFNGSSLRLGDHSVAMSDCSSSAV